MEAKQGSRKTRIVIEMRLALREFVSRAFTVRQATAQPAQVKWKSISRAAWIKFASLASASRDPWLQLLAKCVETKDARWQTKQLARLMQSAWKTTCASASI
jgi:hypothetical protein